MSSNKYEVALDETWELFAEQLSGARAGLVLCVGGEAPSGKARGALESSAKALGYGEGTCTFATVGGLEGNALFVLIEGIDPTCIVATDGKAAALLGQAYKCSVPSGKPSRLLGRTCVAFLDFEEMLEKDSDKQIAWALLKKLPKFGA